MSLEPAVQRAVRDRRLFVWAAFFVPLVVLIGFARSYYLKRFFGGPALPSLLVHVHGLVMTAWVALFVVQVALISTRRTRVHQRLGVWGAALSLAVVIVGVATAISAAARGSAPPGGLTPLQFLVVPLGDMFVFAILVGFALYFRRRVEIHKRLMLLAAGAILPAAIARIPFEFIATGGPFVFFGLTDLCIVAWVVIDTIKHRRLHPAFLWGTLFIVVNQPLRMLLAGTNAWTQFATWLVR